MKKKIPILLSMLLISLTIGCFSTKKSKEDNLDKIGIRGYVTAIDSKENSGTITIEGTLDDDTTYDKAMVEITKGTLIQKDNLSRLFNISDISEGTMVEVIFKGAVQEIYPVHGTADIVRIITTNSDNEENKN